MYTVKIASNGNETYRAESAAGSALAHRGGLCVEDVLHYLGDESERVYQGAPRLEVEAWVDWAARRELVELDAQTRLEVVEHILAVDRVTRQRRDSADRLAAALEASR